MVRQRVIIVGGGIIGTACAYFLSKAGWQVTMLEKEKFGKGCSHGNCGFISPSHVLPLPLPGTITKTARGIFSNQSPVYIKPRIDVRLWMWLLRFAGRCRKQYVLPTAKARQSLLDSSAELYRALITSESLDCEWQPNGMLFVYLHEKEFHEYKATSELLRHELGISVKAYDGQALVELEPALLPGLGGAWYFECDAHVRPDKLVSSWRSVLERVGVEIHEACGVESFASDGKQARAVRTNQGEFQGDHFVVAMGALTPFLNQHLGCRIPIQPGKGYSMTMPRPRICPAIPMIFEHHRVAVTPMLSAYRIGSTMEFSGYDSSINRNRLDMLKNATKYYLRDPFSDTIEEEWCGWRPMTYDGKPYIDFSPRLSNVMVAAGHNMLGVSMAPATGRLVTELICREPPHVDPRPFSLDRQTRG